MFLEWWGDVIPYCPIGFGEKWSAPLWSETYSQRYKKRDLKSKENQFKTMRAVLVCSRNVVSHSTGGWESRVTRQDSRFPFLCQRSVLLSKAYLELFHPSSTRLYQLYQIPTYPQMTLLKVFFSIQNILSYHCCPSLISPQILFTPSNSSFLLYLFTKQTAIKKINQIKSEWKKQIRKKERKSKRNSDTYTPQKDEIWKHNS